MKVQIHRRFVVAKVCVAALLIILSHSNHAITTDELATRDGEYVFGQRWLKATRVHLGERVDPFCTDILETWLTRLRNQFELGPLPLTGLCLNPSDFNAFAAPGGIVGLNRGAYSDLHTEDQVLAVLAHELAHLAQRHHYRSLRQSQQLSTGTLATLAGIVAAIATQQGQAAQSLIMGGQAANAQLALAYSRDFEREADRLGLVALQKSGYRPEAMAQVLSILAAKQSGITRNLSFLSTHPLGVERQSDLEGRIDQLEPEQTRPPLLNERDFYLFRCIQTEGLHAPPSDAYFDQCQILRTALEQFRSTRYTEAFSTFMTLSDTTRNTFTGLDIQIALAIKIGHREIAYESVEAIELFFPSWVTPVVARVDLAAAFGSRLPRQFRMMSAKRADRLDLWRALARFAEQSKQSHLLFEARAWDALLHGKHEAASTQILQAEKNWPEGHNRRPLDRLKAEFNLSESG